MKLRNINKILEMLGFDATKSQMLTFFGKNFQKSAVRHSIEKPVLLNFVNLSSTFRPRLSEETDFHF